MASDWLTTAMVEELHRATSNGSPVRSVIGGLRGTTLPGIVEYGCLRWALRRADLPALPQAVLSSTVGQALGEVPSALGVRSSGPPAEPIRRLDCKSAEFITISTEGDLTNEAWEHYSIRFNRSAQNAGFPRGVGGELQAALQEMAENAVIHSRSEVSVLVGYCVKQGVAQFCVADVGIGILESLRECPEFQHLRLHADAIREALRDGATRFGRNRGGLGFRAVFKALVANWGLLRFRSGTGSITMDGSGLTADEGVVEFPPALPGFQVTISCRTSDAAQTEPLL